MKNLKAASEHNFADTFKLQRERFKLIVNNLAGITLAVTKPDLYQEARPTWARLGGYNRDMIS